MFGLKIADSHGHLHMWGAWDDTANHGKSRQQKAKITSQPGNDEREGQMFQQPLWGHIPDDPFPPIRPDFLKLLLPCNSALLVTKLSTHGAFGKHKEPNLSFLPLRGTASQTPSPVLIPWPLNICSVSAVTPLVPIDVQSFYSCIDNLYLHIKALSWQGLYIQLPTCYVWMFNKHLKLNMPPNKLPVPSCFLKAVPLYCVLTCLGPPPLQQSLPSPFLFLPTCNP